MTAASSRADVAPDHMRMIQDGVPPGSGGDLIEARPSGARRAEAGHRGDVDARSPRSTMPRGRAPATSPVGLVLRTQCDGTV